MNSEALFSIALGLQTPWQVKEVNFSVAESSHSELNLCIGFSPGTRFSDDTGQMCLVHDTVERQWQHLSFFEHVCYLHCAVPRITTGYGNVRLSLDHILL
jgi:transposase